MIKCVLDANVLIPITLADTLLRLAEESLFRPFWSHEILSETTTQLSLLYPNIELARFEYRINEMNRSFPDALQQGNLHLADELLSQLPDVRDAHVFASAISSRADFIVTMNLKDFPKRITEKLDFAAIHPDSFLLKMLKERKEIVLNSVRTQVLQKTSPKIDSFTLFKALAIQVPNFAAELEQIYASTLSEK